MFYSEIYNWQKSDAVKQILVFANQNDCSEFDKKLGRYKAGQCLNLASWLGINRKTPALLINI